MAPDMNRLAARSRAVRSAKAQWRLDQVREAAQAGWSRQAVLARTGLSLDGLKTLLYRRYRTTDWTRITKKEQDQ